MAKRSRSIHAAVRAWFEPINDMFGSAGTVRPPKEIETSRPPETSHSFDGSFDSRSGDKRPRIHKHRRKF